MSIETFYAVRMDDEGLPIIEECRMELVAANGYKLVEPLKHKGPKGSEDKYNSISYTREGSMDYLIHPRNISSTNSAGWVFRSKKMALAKIKVEEMSLLNFIDKELLFASKVRKRIHELWEEIFNEK